MGKIMTSDDEIKDCTVGISPDGYCKYVSKDPTPYKEIKELLDAGYTVERQTRQWCRENLFAKVR
jgi:hypothetical protein